MDWREKTITPQRRRPSLGVLCVHGIGSQKPRETLTAFADPLIDWFPRCTCTYTGLFNKPMVKHVELDPFDSFDDQERNRPPHVAVNLKLSAPPENDRTETVLFAESHWADSFVAPPLSKLVPWLLGRGPWEIFHYATSGFSSRIARFFGLFLAIPVAFVFQTTVCLLWILGIVRYRKSERSSPA